MLITWSRHGQVSGRPIMTYRMLSIGLVVAVVDVVDEYSTIDIVGYGVAEA